jgi:hypothetical protein
MVVVLRHRLGVGLKPDVERVVERLEAVRPQAHRLLEVDVPA